MKFLLFPFIIFSNIIYSQIKLTSENDVEIYFLENKLSLSELNSNKKNYYFKIVNNTSNYIIVSRLGFETEEQYVINEKNKYLYPTKIFLKGRPGELNDCECKNEIIIINPKREIKVSNLDILEIRSNYSLKSKNKYFLVIKSYFNQNFAMLNLIGCENYISELKNKNIKFTNIKISAKIPLEK